jgi:hypothetical protein
MLQATTLPFSLAGPGQTATGAVEITSPANASFTAAITADPHSIFKVVKVTALGPIIVPPEDPDPGDGVKGGPRKPKPIGDDRLCTGGFIRWSDATKRDGE